MKGEKERSGLRRGLAAFFTLLLTVGAGASWAANGVLTGLVLDERTGQPVRSAVLRVASLDREGQSDLNGVFELSLPEGTWAVQVSAEGYQAREVTEVAVAGGGFKNLSVLLSPTGSVAGEDDATIVSENITVQAEAEKATEQALLAERKAAAQIVDNIGSEEIAKNTGSDAAGVLKRVTGISVQEGKYVFVRGLGDRYSNTELNGSRIPSTEFEKKVVPLDLFPADLIDKVTVSKSYTVDQPGDFVAGVVELETKKFPAQQRFTLGIDGGYNSQTTHRRFLEASGGLGFSGGGGQPLPAGFPQEDIKRFSFFSGEGFTQDELETIGEMLVGNWELQPEDAPYDGGFKLSYGNSFDWLGVYLSATWEHDRESLLDERNFYASAGNGELRPKDDYNLETGTEQVRQALMGNFAFRAGQSSQLQLRVLNTTLASNQGRFQFGFLSDLPGDIQDYRIQYRNQDVLALQLSGDHFLSKVGGSGGSVVEWRASSSEATTDENLRETFYRLTNNGYEYSSQGQSGFFFFNDLTDRLDDYRLDWQSFFGHGSGFGSIKVGAAYLDSNRDFDGRRLRYFPRRLSGIDLTASPNDIFTAENINPDNFELREVTNPTDEYTATQGIPAGYVQADWSWGDWRVIGGVRYEDSSQEVTTNDLFQPDVLDVITLDRQDYLPSLSVVYSLGPRTALRGSLSRTVNRPELRELAPFEFITIVGGVTAKGNPELDRATVDSADLRWELFPRGGEVLAASLFYKSFDKPIENTLIAGAQLIESYLNAEEARNAGFELEARKRLDFLTPKLESFTAIVNYTYVDSQVTVDPTKTILTNTERPLVGQPDSIVNLVLEWAPSRWNTTVRLLYNLVGDKVALGGSKGAPDVIEESRSTLDFVWRQGLWRGLGLKLSASNLTDEDKTWTQGGLLWRRYKPGRAYSFSLGYTF